MTLYDDFEFDMSDDAWKQELIDALPAVFNQDDESNIRKIIDILADRTNFWKNNKLAIYDQLRWMTATNGNLTQLANEYGVNRIDDDDNFLRFQISVKIFQRMFGASEIGTKQFIAHVLDIDVNSFDIVPTGHLEEIDINNLPFNFKDDNRKEQKQQIISQSIEENLPPTFKLRDIIYSTQTNETMYYGVATETDVISDEKGGA